eukprot:m.125711 g.125711  ORF g.125711 m.125711 type:complete len:445 (-) comp19793_c0_seq1:37-1371(-)
MMSGEIEPPPQLDFRDSKTFAFKTLRERMPVIVTRVVDDLSQYIQALTDAGEASAELRGAKEGLALVTRLKYEMQTNKPMRLLRDAHGDVGLWNSVLQSTGSDSTGDTAAVLWYDSVWLLAECYMYRRIWEALLTSPLLQKHDPFLQQKSLTYECSLAAMTGLATLLASAPTSSLSKRDLFEIFLQFSLWGNRTDLSLIADFHGQSGSLDHLQAGNLEHLQEARQDILCYEFDTVWTIVEKLHAERNDVVHFVLDNAGFELFTDFCLASWLVENHVCKEVVFHVKDYPWFVSDTMRTDITWLMDWLERHQEGKLSSLGAKWRDLLARNVFQIAESQFWTLPHGFCHMQTVAPELAARLAHASLVVFKGDLNYRKLLEDRAWPPTHPFREAVRGLAPLRLVALRTLKSEVIAGLEPGVPDRAAAAHPDWLVCGKYAVVQAKDKTA